MKEGCELVQETTDGRPILVKIWMLDKLREIGNAVQNDALIARVDERIKEDFLRAAKKDVFEQIREKGPKSGGRTNLQSGYILLLL